MVYPLNFKIQALQLAQFLGLELRGANSEIGQVAPLNAVNQGCLVFSKAVTEIALKSCICIGPVGMKTPAEGALIVSDHPRRDYIKALIWLESLGCLKREAAPTYIHPTAKIGVGVVIESGCEIGEGVVIEPNVVIFQGTRIGAFSRIRANSTIGSDGFGFERDEDGRALQFIHLGGVHIGINVEIGANSCVSRGTFYDTIIEDGVKIDNLVHIAHNVKVCRDAFIIAGAEVSGGCRIGKAAWIGPNACVREKLDIGDGAMIGIGATVISSVPAGAVYAGNPARIIQKKS